VGIGAALAASYAALYGILLSEDYALLFGSLLLFVILAALMLATRKLDWGRLGGSPT
jgi:inner membrane protein